MPFDPSFSDFLRLLPKRPRNAETPILIRFRRLSGLPKPSKIHRCSRRFFFFFSGRTPGEHFCEADWEQRGTCDHELRARSSWSRLSGPPRGTSGVGHYSTWERVYTAIPTEQFRVHGSKLFGGRAFLSGLIFRVIDFIRRNQVIHVGDPEI